MPEYKVARLALHSLDRHSSGSSLSSSRRRRRRRRQQQQQRSDGSGNAARILSELDGQRAAAHHPQRWRREAS